MKITKYEKLMLEIERLAKDKEANAERLQALSTKLALQKEILEKISISKIKEKLKSDDLTAKKYNNFKDILEEKKLYIKNEQLINEVISGNYDNVHQKRKIVFRKFAKVAGTVALITALAFGLHSCGSKKETKKVNNVKSNIESTIDKNDSYSTIKDNNNNKELNKEKENSSDLTKEEDNNSKESKNKDNNNINNINKSNSSTNVGDKTSNSSKVVSSTPEKQEEKIPIQPTTEKEKPSNEKPSTTEQITNEGTTKPPVTPDNIDETGGNDDEKTYNIPDNSKDVPTTPTTEEDKKDTTKEEKPSNFVPNINNVDDGGNEKTYVIDDNTSNNKPYNGTAEDKHDTYEEETTSVDIPSFDIIEGDDEITYDIIEGNDEITYDISSSDKTLTYKLN